MKISNQTKQTPIADQAQKADSPLTRMRGLLNRTSLESGEGLLITQCNSIHMFFMKFAIDVIFIDKTNKVVGLVRNIKPWRLSPIFFKAASCIELPVGVIDQSKTDVGDQIATE